MSAFGTGGKRPSLQWLKAVAIVALAGSLTLAMTGAGAARALSAMTGAAVPTAWSGRDTALSDTPASPQAMPPVQLPMPEAGSGQSGDQAAPDDAAEPDDTPVDDTTTDDPAQEKNVNKPAAALPILHDLSVLPEPVRRMREQIIEAAKSGDLSKLRPLFGKGADQTQLALGAKDSDPVDYLHSVSGDKGGQEILAILLDVLDSGFVDMDKGGPDEAYVWPYFFATPLDKLTPPERVELFRIITAGDFEDMKAYGGYNFYRVGIAPDGQWKFFLAGD